MNDDKRNFRVPYYDKVGCRGIGEKALISLLNNDVVDRKKLENFCIRFSIPPGYRVLIWNILLGILPMQQRSHAFVMKQRTEQYHDLFNAVKAMTVVNKSLSNAETYLKMYLVESGEVNLKCGIDKWHTSFIAIASSVDEMIDLPVEAYWITAKFYEFFKTNRLAASEFYRIIVAVIERVNIKLFNHLITMNFFSNDALNKWNDCGFAGIIHCDGLDKVWDILLGKGVRVLPYIGAYILQAFEHPLLHATTSTHCVEILHENVLDESLSDLVVRRGIEAFKKYEKNF